MNIQNLKPAIFHAFPHQRATIFLMCDSRIAGIGRLQESSLYGVNHPLLHLLLMKIDGYSQIFDGSSFSPIRLQIIRLHNSFRGRSPFFWVIQLFRFPETAGGQGFASITSWAERRRAKQRSEHWRFASWASAIATEIGIFYMIKTGQFLTCFKHV